MIITIPSNMRLIGGEVQYRHTFTCSNCGRQQEGDTRRCDIHDLERARISPHAMPVGWASHYAPAADHFTCPSCNKS